MSKKIALLSKCFRVEFCFTNVFFFFLFKLCHYYLYVFFFCFVA